MSKDTKVLKFVTLATLWSIVSNSLLTGDIHASQYHVSPGASGSGNGSISSPWQFQTALSQPSAVKPGDTIWVHAGTYTGMFISSLNGSAGKPVIVRNYQNDRVTIISPGSWRDGIQVNGSYTWFWGLEVTSDPASPLDQPSSGFNVGAGSSGDGLKIINCVVHDQVGGGFGWWLPATNAEINGCLTYYNGREMGAGNDAHNYGIYAQNVGGNKLFKDNIDGYNWSYSAHVYSEQQGVDNITFDGDVLYQAGYIWHNPNGGTFERNLIMGGSAAQGRDGDVVKNCHLYYSNTNGYDGARLSIGYFAPMTNFTMTGNTIVGGVNEFSYSGTVSGNTFYNTTGDQPAGNTYSNSPGGTQVIVRPNDYEQGRANIIIYNWPHNPSVGVDFSSFLSNGSTYTVRDAHNYYGAPVVTGTYNGGTVSIPMNSTAISSPMLASGQTLGAQPFNTQPEFGVFIVTAGTGGSAPPVPTGTFTASPATLPTGGGTVTLTWTSQNATSASVSPGVGAVALSGSTTANVASSTSFKLTLVGQSGTTEYNTSVSVTAPAPPAPTGTFTASPATLPFGGGTVTLTWSSQNATSASVSPGVGAVPLSGSTTVNVTSSTTFKLTLVGPAGTTAYNGAVSVSGTAPSAPTGTFTASPATLPAGGGKVTLTWSSQNGTSASITPGVGTVALSGSTSLDVSTSSTYTLHLTGAGGTASYGASVTVNAAAPAPTVDLTATPAMLPAGGGSVTLAWTSQNAASASIQGIGPVPLSGSQIISVTQSTTWILSMSGPGGTQRDTASVAVAPPAPDAPSELSKEPQLSQNYPNPFNGGTAIRYLLPTASFVVMRVYNILGAIVAELANAEQEAGYHEVRFNTGNLSSGVYYYSFRAGSYVDMKKMIYIK